MARPIIQVTLALLLIIVFIHTSKGGVDAEQMEELQTKSEQSPPQGIEQPKWRTVREAGRKNANGRQNKKIGNKKMKGKRKSKRTETKLRQGKKKLRHKKIKSRKNRINRRKHKHENKKKARNNKKKSRGNKKKSRRNKKKSRKGYKQIKKNKKVSRQNKKRSKKKKNKQKKTKRKRGKRVKKLSKHKQNSNGTTCDEKALGQKIKDYIKISNSLRQAKRLKKACDTMEKKANKSGSEFEATVNALTSALGTSSGRRMYLTRSRWRQSSECKEELTGIKDKLKNCSKSAKAKCQKSSVEACQNETQNSNCEKELNGWLEKFGPSKGSCLQASDNYCTCITALPDVSKDCLKFDNISKMAVNSKKKCTSGDEKGSFGFCKKLQIEAAEKGPGAGKCQPPGIDTAGVITTRKPTTTTSKYEPEESERITIDNNLDDAIKGVVSLNPKCPTDPHIPYAIKAGGSKDVSYDSDCFITQISATPSVEDPVPCTSLSSPSKDQINVIKILTDPFCMVTE